MMIEDIYLTASGIESLKQELEHLKTHVRQDLAKRLRAAIQMGDLSENADYISTKEEQGFVEGRIQELEHILKHAKVIENSTSNLEEIQIGCEVVVQEEGFEEETFIIVGSKEANPVSGKISYESPIGKSLLGHKVGEIVRIPTPSGFTNFKVIQIK
jgi:transcription elongation factor GreA